MNLIFFFTAFAVPGKFLSSELKKKNLCSSQIYYLIFILRIYCSLYVLSHHALTVTLRDEKSEIDNDRTRHH